MRRRKRPALAVVGAGRLARSLVPVLHEAGYPIAAVAARRSSAARALCREIPRARATTDPLLAARSGEVVMLAVPDRALGPLARELAVGSSDWRGRVALHHAGALGPEPLRPLGRLGAATGLLHPLQALADPAVARSRLSGSYARVEGDPTACRVARAIARDLGMTPFTLPGKSSAADRAIYHAAASLASNDLVALIAQAADLLETTGMSRSVSLRALLPLAAGTLAQAQGGVLEKALSGPLMRGDVETLQRQLATLDRRSRRAAELHRRLSQRLLDATNETKRPLSAATRARLRRLLRS